MQEKHIVIGYLKTVGWVIGNKVKDIPTGYEIEYPCVIQQEGFIPFLGLASTNTMKFSTEDFIGELVTPKSELGEAFEETVYPSSIVVPNSGIILQ